jgi:hypothetical protein
MESRSQPSTSSTNVLRPAAVVPVPLIYTRPWSSVWIGFFLFIVFFILLTSLLSDATSLTSSSATPTPNVLIVVLKGDLNEQLWTLALAGNAAVSSGRRLQIAPQSTRRGVLNSFLASWDVPATPLAVKQTVPVALKSGANGLTSAVAGMTSARTIVVSEPVEKEPQAVYDVFCQSLRLPLLPSSRLTLRSNMAFLEQPPPPSDTKSTSTITSGLVRAISAFPPDTVFLVLKTNEPEQAATQDDASVREALPSHRVIYPPQPNFSEWEKLTAMIACPRGGIYTHTTLSWWGARIGRVRGVDAAQRVYYEIK